MDVPETRYAKSGDLRIAYQVIGSGELDLVFIQGFVSNLDLCWEEPGWAYFLSRLASFSRLIVFDKRGTGLSDRTEGAPTLEERMDDLRAVMDAAGSSRTALFGFSEGGPMSLLFAASYPERVRAIGIYGSFARGSDLSGDLLRQRIEQNIARIERAWGTGEVAKNFAPNKARDPAYFRHLARWERHGASRRSRTNRATGQADRASPSTEAQRRHRAIDRRWLPSLNPATGSLSGVNRSWRRGPTGARQAVSSRNSNEAEYGAPAPHFRLLELGGSYCPVQSGAQLLGRLERQLDPRPRTRVEVRVDEVERYDIAQGRMARVVIGDHRLR
jgi:pimeloyl-ACP methyl ester carboxylesterase